MVVEIIMGSVARKGDSDDDGAAAAWLQASNALQAAALFHE